MQTYYFTFLTSHYNLRGEWMAPYWVRVIASDYMSARLLFIEQFSVPEMGRADKWGFQYYEPNWIEDNNAPSFYGGEYVLIEEVANEKSN